jgi:outer membrane protein
VLEQQLKQTRDRFQVGEVTLTDVAQAEASLAQARTELYSAQAQLKNSVANYRQIIGVDPGRLEPGRSVEAQLPKSLSEAVQIALVEHPGAVAAMHQADAAELAVKVAESALSPSLSIGAQVSNQYDSFLGIPGSRQFSAGVSGQLNIRVAGLRFRGFHPPDGCARSQKYYACVTGSTKLNMVPPLGLSSAQSFP